MHEAAIVWFRRDLRLRDNLALADAIKRARVVIPVFVFAPEEEGVCTHGAASRWWLHHSLSALDQRLRERGSRLVIRRGATFESLCRVAQETKATLITWNRLYEPQLEARDRAVEKALQEANIEIATHTGNVLMEPGSIRNGQKQPYRVFTAFWRAAAVQLEQLPPPLPVPRRIPSPAAWPEQHSLESLALRPRISWDSGLAATWTPGEAGASAQLRSFQKRINAYDETRNRPDVIGTSRLSPHFHFGEIAARQLMESIRSSAQSSGSQSYARQLRLARVRDSPVARFSRDTDSSTGP